MDKIVIIGLGFVGNSMGLALKRALQGGNTQIVGFDPDRDLEDAALKKHNSVDTIAPDLETAVRGAQMVILAVPASAVREVLQAIDNFLDDSAVVTDTLSSKEQIMSWAGELLTHGSFVGGHPLSRTIDTESPSDTDQPSADLFAKAPYCIMPLPSASGDALNRVIGMAEAMGAQPLFIDPWEHDSLFAAASHLPLLASTALMRLAAASPSWQDIGSLARSRFDTLTSPLASDPEALAGTLAANRRLLMHWIDQYLLVLQDLRDMLAEGETGAIEGAISEAHAAREQWLRRNRESEAHGALAGRQTEVNDELREELQQAMRDNRPGSRLFGRYLTDRIFGKKENR